MSQTARFYSADDYLLNSLTSCLMQDSRGFLWSGTRYGLVRFDGHRFRHFVHNDEDSLSLNFNNVLCLSERPDEGDILVGTVIGIDSYNHHSQTFFHVPLIDEKGRRVEKGHVRCLLTLSNGEVLAAVAGWGMFRIKPERKEAVLDLSINFYGYADVVRMAEGSNGDIWLMTPRTGVCRLRMNRKGDVVDMKTFLVQESPTSDLSCITAMPDGNVAVGTTYRGVFLYDAANSRFHHLKTSERMNVSALCTTRGGQLMIGTDGEGMTIYDPADGSLKPCGYHHRDVDVDAQKIYDIKEDREGNIWLACFQKGLFIQPAMSSTFSVVGQRAPQGSLIGNHCVMSVMHGKDGTLWVGTDNDGLYGIEKNGDPGPEVGGVKHYASGNTIMGMTESADGRLWIATYLNGCGWVDRQSGVYHQLDCTSTGEALHAMSVVEDGKGRLWIATNGDGLLCYNPNTRQTVSYKADPDHQERTNVVTNNWLGALTLSKDKSRLYLCMSSGMMSMDLQTDSFEIWPSGKTLLSGQAVRAIREGNDGCLWVATAGGLHKVEMCGKQRITTLTMHDGLPADDVVSVEPADDGTVWAGTVHGLVHYNPATKQMNSYYAASGLQGNEYSNGASCRGRDGRLFFGGSSGVSYFHPANLKPQTLNFKPHITGIMLNGQEVTARTRSGSEPICQEGVLDASTFTFAHYDNSFTVALSALNYARADGLQYAYRTDNGAWVMLPQGNSDLTLNHLASGKYNIEVKATDGQAESDIMKFQVVVRPPAYATWWAYTIYITIALLLLAWYLHNRQRKEQARLRLQEFIHQHESDAQQLNNLQATIDVYASQLRQNRHRDHLVTTIANESVAPPEESVTSPDDRLLERVMHFVSSHIADPDLSVELIAQEVGISRSHLHRKMKELTNQTTVDLIRSIRLQRAARLLAEGNMSVSDVMYACGFSFASSFATTFKKFYGMSPTEFAKQNHRER